uniref:protein ALP1-like n=1 Tax=Erigeron canadensis TaxID=72917 RepID=UPI001CB9D561|nr:protein ALP1-like [Erigeron canadensis]
MEKHIGSTTIIDEPFEWFDDSSLEVFANAIKSEDVESSTARSRAKRKVVNRNRWTASQKLHRDYFCEEPKYDDYFFEDRYRMPKRLFLKIVHDLESRYEYFQDSYDARLAKSFYTDTEVHICHPATCNRTEYLRKPTTHDLHCLFEANEERHHLPGMIGSLDCTHLVWKMCPMEWRGQYKRGNHEYPTIMLEATASQDLWIWHAFFGPPGALNDINVLQQSSLFLSERLGTAPYCPFTVNGRTYRRGYYLVNDIYLTWSTFVKAYKYPTDPKEKMFKTAQEAARKDIERAFGVLKGKWHIIDRLFRKRPLGTIRNLVYACVILHNMIIQDSGRAICPVHIGDPVVHPSSNRDALPEIQDEETHFRPRYDLTEHLAGLNLPHLQPKDE